MDPTWPEDYVWTKSWQASSRPRALNRWTLSLDTGTSPEGRERGVREAERSGAIN